MSTYTTDVIIEGKHLTLEIEEVQAQDGRQFFVHAKQGTMEMQCFSVKESKGEWNMGTPLINWIKRHQYYLLDMVKRTIPPYNFQ